MKISYQDNVFMRSFQFSNLWKVFIDEELQYLAKNITIGNNEIDFDSINGIMMARDVNFNHDYTIEFLETTDMEILTFLKKWRSNDYDENTKKFKIGTRRIKQVRCALYSYSNGIEEESISFIMHNTRIKAIEPYNFDYESGDPLKTIVNFTCNRIEIIKIDQSRESSKKSEIDQDSFAETEEFGF